MTEHFLTAKKSNPAYPEVWRRGKRRRRGVLATPTSDWELPAILASVQNAVSVPLGIHAHDDAGMAVANSLLAVPRGNPCPGHDRLRRAVRQRQPLHDYPHPAAQMNLPVVTRQLKSLTAFARVELANMVPLEQQPYVGNNAFAHKGGIHVDAVHKNPETYEHMTPPVGTGAGSCVGAFRPQQFFLKARESTSTSPGLSRHEAGAAAPQGDGNQATSLKSGSL